MKRDVEEIEGLRLFKPARHDDPRGFFSEVYRTDRVRESIGLVDFVQDNVSLSRGKGIIRGLHYQAPPGAQGKLVRVSRGAVLDVAVDARPSSTTFRDHVALELSDENWRQLWIPPGFLHGFCTLTDEVELSYKVTDYYSAKHDGAVAFDDPSLAIDWPVDRQMAILSAKDSAAVQMLDWSNPF